VAKKLTKPLVGGKECPVDNFINPLDAKFCQNCGHDFTKNCDYEFKKS
jgi:hypothetical protein